MGNPDTIIKSPEQRKRIILCKISYFVYLRQDPKLSSLLDKGLENFMDSDITFYENLISEKQKACDHDIDSKKRIKIVVSGDESLNETFCATCGTKLA
jgi:hypothetical protein